MDNKHFFLIVFLIVVISGSSVYAETFGYGRTQTIPINYSNIVINETSNQSEYWNTNIGTLDNANTTQFENNGETLSIINSWLTSFFNLLFGTKTTDDLTEGSINLYDNQSWNETRADTIYATIINTFITVKDGETIQSTINGITDASASKPYVVFIPSGIYNEQIIMKDYVSLKGAGRTNTIINGSYTYLLTYANEVEISNLKINNEFKAGGAIAIGCNLASCSSSTVYINDVDIYGYSDVVYSSVENVTIYMNNIHARTDFDGFVIINSAVRNTFYISNSYLNVSNLDSPMAGALRIDVSDTDSNNTIIASNMLIEGTPTYTGYFKTVSIGMINSGDGGIQLHNVNIDLKIDSATDNIGYYTNSDNAVIKSYGGSINLEGGTGIVDDIYAKKGNISIFGTKFSTYNETGNILGVGFNGGGLIIFDGDINASQLDNPNGNLQIQPNTANDVELFKDFTVADNADGKKLIIWRNAISETDTSFQLYANQYRQFIISMDGGTGAASVIQTPSDRLMLRTKTGLILQDGAEADISMFEQAGSGENPSLTQAGYITNGANEVEIMWTVKDTDDYFWLERENTNLLGFKIDMPVDLIDNNLITTGRIKTGELIIPSGTTPTPTVEGALFLDTDASVNGDLLIYSNGAWRTIQIL